MKVDTFYDLYYVLGVLEHPDFIKKYSRRGIVYKNNIKIRVKAKFVEYHGMRIYPNVFSPGVYYIPCKIDDFVDILKIEGYIIDKVDKDVICVESINGDPVALLVIYANNWFFITKGQKDYHERYVIKEDSNDVKKTNN
jgi:hypothetical protein